MYLSRRVGPALGLILGFVSRPVGGTPSAQAASAPAEIVLASVLVAEKPGTLAVIDSEGALLPNVTVELSTGRRVTTDQTGRARFVVTSDPGPFLAAISGTEVRASSVVVPSPETPASVVLISSCPPAITRGEHFTVEGASFRGDADENRVTLGGQPALVMAASPVALEIWPSPEVALGASSLRIEIAKSGSAAVSIDLVTLGLEQAGRSQSAGKLAAGKRQPLVVHVFGTQKPMPLAIWDLSPDVVEFAGGSFQRVLSTGGADNRAELPLRGLRNGDFDVSVRLAARGSTQPDLHAAHAALEAARVLAQGDWAPRISAASERLGTGNSHAAEVSEDLERMLEENPPRDVGRHLVAAWIALAD